MIFKTHLWKDWKDVCHNINLAFERYSYWFLIASPRHQEGEDNVNILA